jgi:hypothetical protein
MLFSAVPSWAAPTAADPFATQERLQDEQEQYDQAPEYCEELHFFVKGWGAVIIITVTAILLYCAIFGKMTWPMFGLVGTVIALAYAIMRFTYYTSGGELGACDRYFLRLAKEEAARVDLYAPVTE